MCANLTDPDNGQVVSLTDDNNPGSVALYSCLFGYELTGIQGNTRSCMATGEWEGTDPTCQGKNLFQRVSAMEYFLLTMQQSCVHFSVLPPMGQCLYLAVLFTLWPATFATLVIN